MLLIGLTIDRHRDLKSPRGFKMGARSRQYLHEAYIIEAFLF
jgi:hypothetical protein